MTNRDIKNLFGYLEERLGCEYLNKRLKLQKRRSALRNLKGFKIHWEDMDPVYILLKIFLDVTGLYRKANSNTLGYEVDYQNVYFKNLPNSFHNFRILHLSDIHIEGIPDGGKRLAKHISGMDYDICLITGDYRYLTHMKYKPTIEKMKRITEAVKCRHGIFGILGNHDYIDMVPGLESLGIRILINEAIKLEENGERIWIAGVDDPSLDSLADIPGSLENVSRDDFKILLAHSPEIIDDAAKQMIDYYICGHTHGGQICLPGGFPIIANSQCSRRHISGAWMYQGMKGYTSKGVGASGLAVRLNCPPQITLHYLKQKEY